MIHKTFDITDNNENRILIYGDKKANIDIYFREGGVYSSFKKLLFSLERKDIIGMIEVLNEILERNNDDANA